MSMMQGIVATAMWSPFFGYTQEYVYNDKRLESTSLLGSQSASKHALGPSTTLKEFI
jgi:hypothetical protein